MANIVCDVVGGDETYELALISDKGGHSPTMGGVSEVKWSPHQMQLPTTIDEQLFVERWQLIVKDSRGPDGIARQMRSLQETLRRAWAYHMEDFFMTPIHLRAKAECETGVRTALIYQAPEMTAPWPMWDPPLEQSQIVNLWGISIARFVWRAGIPGVLPACTPLPFIQTDLEAAELVVNGGFETAGGGGADVFGTWTESAGDGAIADETTLFHGGAHAAKLTAGASTNALLRYTLSITAGVTYQLTFWTRGDGANAGRYALYKGDWSGDIISITGTGIAGTTYTQYSVAFTGPAGQTQAYLDLKDPPVNGGIAYFDDVSVKMASPWGALSDDCTIHVANYQDDHELTHIFVEDNSAGTYSANLLGTAAHAYFPAVPAANDAIYFGADDPFWTIQGNVLTAGVFVWTLVAEYWSGAAWTALTLGTEYTMWPYSLSDSLKRVGHWQFNWRKQASGWAKTAVNGQNKFWIRFRISAFTSTATSPTNGTTAIYNLHQSYFDIPEAAMKGDGPPYAMLRIQNPYGSTGNSPVLGTTSRIIVGSKSRGLAGFTAFLNAGGDGNPAAWATAYGTDTASTALPDIPGGDYALVSFATSATMQYRVRFTGTDILEYYPGKYRVFLRCYQNNGAAGDVRIKARFRINGAADTDPVWETGVVETPFFNEHMVMDLTPGGFILLPFGDVVDADILTLADLIVEIHAERSGGVSTLGMYDLILMPCDEWIADLDDPITDTTTGASALRGYSLLDVDSGIIGDRTVKQVLGFTLPTVTPPIYYAEGWQRRGAPMRLANGRTNRLFFLSMGYTDDYTTSGLAGLTGRGLTVEVYLQPIYFYLRGDD